MRKFIGFLLFPCLLISQSPIQDISLAGLGRTLSQHTATLNNPSSFAHPPGFLLGISHQRRGALKDLDLHSFQISYRRQQAIFAASYQHFGNDYYQENHMSLAYGMRLSPKIRLAARGELVHLMQIERPSTWFYSASIIAQFRLNSKLASCIKHQAYWKEGDLKHALSMEWQMQANSGFNLLLGGFFDFAERLEIKGAWQYRIIEGLFFQQGLSHKFENTWHFGLNWESSSIGLLIACAYGDLSAWTLGLGCNYRLP